ncbi:MAG: DUF423 domain-containing protein [Bdellovibrionales bacterium]|nr:DUF423 domain-containing protein [Bdellovibrionales bacterium]
MGNLWISVGSALGALGVITGAFAAHALQGKVEDQALEWMKTGAHYQMIHALALLAWGLWTQFRIQAGSSAPGVFPGWGFALGVVIFSGSLYIMALGGPRWLGAITPIGGSLMIAAWIVFSVQAFRS